MRLVTETGITVLNADGSRKVTTGAVLELETLYGLHVAVALTEYQKLKDLALEGKEPEFKGHLPKDGEVLKDIFKGVVKGTKSSRELST